VSQIVGELGLHELAGDAHELANDEQSAVNVVKIVLAKALERLVENLLVPLLAETRLALANQLETRAERLNATLANRLLRIAQRHPHQINKRRHVHVEERRRVQRELFQHQHGGVDDASLVALSTDLREHESLQIQHSRQSLCQTREPADPDAREARLKQKKTKKKKKKIEKKVDCKK
jgi:hypothetical protein